MSSETPEPAETAAPPTPEVAQPVPAEPLEAEKGAPVGVGAYVVLADENLLEKHFFVGPCSGGLTVKCQAHY